jgi:hypothetical protein
VGHLFGAMTRVSWKQRETFSDHQVFVATNSGECLSIDHLISTQVGFIAQFKGTLTKKYYTTMTVSIDHYFKLKYIHLMMKLTSEEMIGVKRAFKHFAKQHGVRILQYHCGNGRFADNAFKNICSHQKCKTR